MPRDEGCERDGDGLIEATGLGGTEHGALQCIAVSLVILWHAASLSWGGTTQARWTASRGASPARWRVGVDRCIHLRSGS